MHLDIEKIREVNQNPPVSPPFKVFESQSPFVIHCAPGAGERADQCPVATTDPDTTSAHGKPISRRQAERMAAFLVCAANAMPFLLKRVRELEEELGRVRAELEAKYARHEVIEEYDDYDDEERGAIATRLDEIEARLAKVEKS